MSSQNDADLLREYVETGSERAFAELTERHVNLVYTAAWRQVRNRHAAEDLTQTVFLVLAMKARKLRVGTVISAWLLVATRFVAKDWLKREARRLRLETAVAERGNRQMEQNQTRFQTSTDVDGVLDDALSKLSVASREAVVLRFFEDRNFGEIGTRLGISEAAARQRVFRAIQQLADQMKRAGVSMSAQTLGATLMTTAVTAAPSGLAKTAAAAAVSGASAAKHAALAKGVITLMAWTKTKIIIASVTAALLIGGTTATVVHLSARNTGKVIVLTPPSSTDSAPTLALADNPLPQPAGVVAADLVRGVRDSESWIDHVKSLSIRLESTWTKTPEAIELYKAELKRQSPTAELTVEKFPGLRPLQTDIVHIAFDGSRVRNYDERFGSSIELHIWDGQRAIYYDHNFPANVERFGFSKSLPPAPLSGMTWPDAGFHRYWWTSPGPEAERNFADPSEFEVMGRETYHGVDCWILNERGQGFGRWHVGVADHLLHGFQIAVLSGNPARDQIAKEMGAELQHPVTSRELFFAWVDKLPTPQRDAIYIAYFTRLHRTDRPSIENWMFDYKEISPGRLLPMTQGYIIYNDDFAKPIARIHREMKIVEVQVDQDLPAEWFTVEMKEGVTVIDNTQNPQLVYKYKAKMSPEEWAAIKQEAVDRDRRSRQPASTNTKPR